MRRARFVVLTRLPRLIMLVRIVRENPSNWRAAQKAAVLALELLDLGWDVPDGAAASLRTTPTQCPRDAVYVAHSFAFAPSDYYVAQTHALHWACKIMLIGLCESLQGHVPHFRTQQYSPTVLWEEGYRCALRICGTIQFAFSLAPYGPVPFIFPLQLAWGVFWRRAGGSETGVTTWLLDKINAFTGLVGGRPVKTVGLRFVSLSLSPACCGLE